MKALSLTIPFSIRVYTVWATLCLIVLSLVSYIFFIQQAVFRTVERTHIGSSVRSLASEVGNLESRYISFGSSVNLTTATTYGLREVANPEFISRTGLENTLSFNTVR